MSRLLLLCPGQGGQDRSMFDLARTDPQAAAFVHAHVADAGDLFENRVAQPLIVTATLAMWCALRDRVPAPALVAGYSIGELAAWSVADALGPADTVALAVRRAACMDAAAAVEPQGMLAVSGVLIETIRVIATAARAAPAIITGDDSAIVGGGLAALARVEHEAVLRNARCQRLQVQVASHTPLMAPAVEPFAQALQATAFARPACPVLSGIAASRIESKDEAVTHLSRQLAQTIEWAAYMDAAVEYGIDVVLELGPGAALARMFRTRHPDVACRSVSEFRSLDGIAAWLDRQA